MSAWPQLVKLDKRKDKHRTTEQKRRAGLKQSKLNKRVFGGDTARDMTERVGKIRIKSSTYEEHLEKTKKELPDHLQHRHHKGGAKRQRRKTSPVTEFNSVFEDVLQVAADIAWSILPWNLCAACGRSASAGSPQSIPSVCLCVEHFSLFFRAVTLLLSQAILKIDASASFRNPVDVRKNPNYRAVIKRPIDLGEMRQKAKEQKYPDQKAFLEDLELMVRNCKEYNRKSNLMLVSEAVEVQRLVQVELLKHKTRVGEAEGMIGLRDIFIAVLDDLLVNPLFLEFRRPVMLPDYTRVIKTPMDLGTMKEKAKAYTYPNREAFSFDLALIRRNCHDYCEKNHPAIPPIADKLYDTGQTLLSKRHGDLSRLEGSVGTWANTTRGTPGTSFPGTPSGRRSPSGIATPGTHTPNRRVAHQQHHPFSPGHVGDMDAGRMAHVGGYGRAPLDPVFDAGAMEQDGGEMGDDDDGLAAELDDAMDEEYGLENEDDVMMLGEGMQVHALGDIDDF